MNIDPKTGDIREDGQVFESPILAICFTVLKYIIMLFLYVGAICVCYGIYTYQPPKGMWPKDEIPPVSPAVACTVILATQFFILYFAVQVSKTVTDFLKVDMSKIELACITATNAMNFAPMLAVLFIAARMRALQMDPLNGAPQPWAQNCFYACTYALLVQCILAIAIPLVVGGEVKKRKRTRTVRNAQGELEKVEYDDETGDVQYEVQHE